MSAPEYLTPDEVARLVRCDRKSIYAAIHSGRLPAIQIGRVYRVKRDHVDSMLAAAPTVELDHAVINLRPRPVTGRFARLARGFDEPST